MTLLQDGVTMFNRYKHVFIGILHLYVIYLFLQLPFKHARNTYISEFNLQCSVRLNRFSLEQLEETETWMQELKNRNHNCLDFIEEKCQSFGLEYERHFFHRGNKGQHGGNKGQLGENLVCLLRAKRAGTDEGIVLSMAYDTPNSESTVAFGLSVLKHFLYQKYLSKDLIFVFSSEGGEVSGLDKWMFDYQKRLDRKMLRSGKLFSGISLDKIGLNQELDRFIVIPEALVGQPNLDLVNVFTNTVYFQKGRAGLDPSRKHEPIKGNLRGLFLFIWNSALSVPRTTAAYFSKYGVPAVGMTTSIQTESFSQIFLNPLTRETVPVFENKFGMQNNFSRFHFEAVGTLLDTAIHHLQNTDEGLHQSFAEYVLTGATDFFENEQNVCILLFTLSILIYPIAFALTDSEFITRVLSALIDFISYFSVGILVYIYPQILQGNLDDYPQVLAFSFCLYCLIIVVGFKFFMRPIRNWLHRKVGHSFQQNFSGMTTVNCFFFLFCLSYFGIANNSFPPFLIFSMPLVEVVPYHAKNRKQMLAFATRILLSIPAYAIIIIYSSFVLGITTVFKLMIRTNFLYDSMLWRNISVIHLPLIISSISMIQ